MKRVLICLGLSLLFCGTAQADQYNSHSGNIGKWIDIAEDYWGESKDCLNVIKAVDPDADFLGWAELGGCEIEYNFVKSDKLWIRCQTIVHEYGHLLGHDHNSRYRVMRNVMAWKAIPRCYKRKKQWR